MPESNDEKQRQELRELEGKNIAHYQTLLSAWIGTRMEQDKMVITLSAAAIGLLVTIVTTVGIKGFWPYFFLIISLAGFIIAIFSCLHIFQVNATHLEENLRSQSIETSSKLLKKLDIITMFCFYTAIICAVSMAVLTSVQKSGGDQMTKKKSVKSQKVENLQESFDGIKKLEPPKLVINSFNGIGNLSPQNLQSSSNSNANSQNKPTESANDSTKKEK